jgi:hypothetical protein
VPGEVQPDSQRGPMSRANHQTGHRGGEELRRSCSIDSYHSIILPIMTTMSVVLTISMRHSQRGPDIPTSPVKPVSIRAATARRGSELSLGAGPGSQCSPHDHQLSEVIRRVICRQEKLTQIGLTGSRRDSRQQIDL